MDPNIIYIILFGALGVFLGTMRSRSVYSDLFVLGIWVAFFLFNPTAAMACAIGGYLVGWGYRFMKERSAGSKDDDGQDPGSQG